MGTVIMVLILVVIIGFAGVSSYRHLKGEGGCCGGGSTEKPKRKKLNGKIVAKKVMYIEGMHCKKCKNSIEQKLNQIDGIAASVNLKQNIAEVFMTQIVSDEELKTTVENINFVVKNIKTEDMP